jgi:hypothetical protein
VLVDSNVDVRVVVSGKPMVVRVATGSSEEVED